MKMNSGTVFSMDVHNDHLIDGAVFDICTNCTLPNSMRNKFKQHLH